MYELWVQQIYDHHRSLYVILVTALLASLAATVRRVRPQLYTGPSRFRNISSVFIPAFMFLPVRLLRPREAVRTTRQDKHGLEPRGPRAP
jgi:hypothetical protein